VMRCVTYAVYILIFLKSTTICMICLRIYMMPLYVPDFLIIEIFRIKNYANFLKHVLIFCVPIF
jgi:hypothetical protein